MVTDGCRRGTNRWWIVELVLGAVLFCQHVQPSVPGIPHLFLIPSSHAEKRGLYEVSRVKFSAQLNMRPLHRGVGNSYTPADVAEYSTDLMAGDTLGLMDHLGWRSAHVVGMSMGGALQGLPCEFLHTLVMNPSVEQSTVSV